VLTPEVSGAKVALPAVVPAKTRDNRNAAWCRWVVTKTRCGYLGYVYSVEGRKRGRAGERGRKREKERWEMGGRLCSKHMRREVSPGERIALNPALGTKQS
jgi:hypothetical protein